MTENNNIENLFQSKFQNFEAPVDASAWQAIQSSVQPVATPAAVATKGISAAAKLISAIVGTAAIVATVVYFSSDKKETTQPVSAPATISEQAPETQPAASATQNKVSVKENASNKNTSSDKNTSAVELNNKADETVTDITPSSTPDNSTSKDLTGQSEKSTPDNGLEKVTPPTESNPVVSKPENTEQTSDQHATAAGEKSAPKSLPFPLKKNTTITPNGDGLNDVLRLETENLNLKNIQVQIFNTNGRLVKSWSNIDGSWDGKERNGNDAPEGTYNIAIFATSFDGTIYKTSTQINLLRTK